MSYVGVTISNETKRNEMKKETKLTLILVGHTAVPTIPMRQPTYEGSLVLLPRRVDKFSFPMRHEARPSGRLHVRPHARLLFIFLREYCAAHPPEKVIGVFRL
jgi:hypothetical protein